jgi:YidC/Oxa1 family membrane protein insertase
VRFNSSSQPPAIPNAPLPQSSTPSEVPQLPSLDDVINLSKSNLAELPERIGYLKDLGLDYGWGPTAFAEWLLEHVHIYTGTPWWASIVITAVLVRVALTKPMLKASSNAAKMGVIKPMTEPITQRMNQCRKQADQTGMLEARQELMRVYKRAGINPLSSFVPLIQVPIGYGIFRLLRGMANLPVPGLESGGFLWFQDLSASDPFFILPIATAGMFHLVARVSSCIPLRDEI